MTRTAYALSAWIVVALLASAVGAAHAQAFKDIEYNWAKEHIEELEKSGVVAGYPDGTFRPERSVTRAEFAKMISVAFGAIDEALDDESRPESPMTRAEVVSSLIRVLRLDDVKGYAQTPSFSDVPSNHMAYDSVETALRLKILPPYLRGSLSPDQPATRAETAAMIREALRLHTVRGAIDYLEPTTRTVGVRTETQARDVFANADTVIHRNTNIVSYDQLVVGDEVYVAADRFGEPQFIKANGVITQEDVATKVKNMTRGLLTPNDLRLALAGDWKGLADSLKSAVYDRLIEQGATPMEAASIMSQDWELLQHYGKDRLAQVIAEQLGIPPELANAVMEGDWDQAQNLAQSQAIEELLGQLLLG